MKKLCNYKQSSGPTFCAPRQYTFMYKFRVYLYVTVCMSLLKFNIQILI